MKISKSLLIIAVGLALCLLLAACNSGGATAFSAAEEELFNSSFGFIVPFIQSERYEVSEYNGYNYDLKAEENGISFISIGLTEEACVEYRKALDGDESYNYEYKDSGFYYFSRGDFFVKITYFSDQDGYVLEVYVYSYKFDEVENPGDDSNKDDDNKDDNGGEDEPEVGFVYEKVNFGYAIIGFLGDEDGIVEIPDTYMGEPVLYIRGNAFFRAEVITELIIGDNLKCIEGNAFMLCANLEKVTLGQGLELIDRQAFYGCSKLEEIAIPASVVFIGSGAFGNCSMLKSVVLEDATGWCTSDDLYNVPFPSETMSNAETVAKYFTDTYTRVAWLK